jgi:peroxiredoxin
MTGVPRLAAPFDLPTAHGETRSLAALLERGRVLLVFHRGTW